MKQYVNQKITGISDQALVTIGEHVIDSSNLSSSTSTKTTTTPSKYSLIPKPTLKKEFSESVLGEIK